MKNVPNRTGSPMTRADAVAAVTTFSDAIRTAYKPVKVVLYGSYARDDQQIAEERHYNTRRSNGGISIAGLDGGGGADVTV